VGAANRNVEFAIRIGDRCSTEFCNLEVLFDVDGSIVDQGLIESAWTVDARRAIV
jgi:hypothetical protein